MPILQRMYYKEVLTAVGKLWSSDEESNKQLPQKKASEGGLKPAEKAMVIKKGRVEEGKLKAGEYNCGKKKINEPQCWSTGNRQN